MFCFLPAGLMWLKLNKACSVTVLKSHWFTKRGPPQKMFAKYKFVTSLLYQRAHHHNELNVFNIFFLAEKKNPQKKSIECYIMMRLQYVNINSQASSTQEVKGCGCGRRSHEIAQEPRKLFSLVVITTAPLLSLPGKRCLQCRWHALIIRGKSPRALPLTFQRYTSIRCRENAVPIQYKLRGRSSSREKNRAFYVLISLQ